MTTPDLASIIDEQEAEIVRLRAELAMVRLRTYANVESATARALDAEAEICRLVSKLAVVRRDWQADVGTLTAWAQTAEARATALELERDAARAEVTRLREIIVQHDTSLFDNCAAQKRNGDCANEGMCDSCPRQWTIAAALRGPAQSEKP